LLVNILNELSYNVESILIDDLKDNIYYAKINLKCGDEKIQIDSRPSDAMAIALRTNAEIYVKKKVFALFMGLNKASKKFDKETLKEVLENIEIDDAGKNIM
ncbi:bifunctional nuclease family protein, partial [Spirochaetota bacterium]